MKRAPSWSLTRAPNVLTPPSVIGASGSISRSAKIIEKTIETNPTYKLEPIVVF